MIFNYSNTMNTILQFFCPLWGSDKIPFNTFLSNVKNAGYDGVEMSLPLDVKQRNEIVASIQSHQLKLIAQHWETVDNDFNTHLVNYKKRLNNLVSSKPLFINSQTGKDYYTMEQNEALIKAAAEIEKADGVKIIHETHRGKFSFAAHVTKIYLDKLPSLQLCLDISHWCCVAETLLEDQPEAVQQAIEHTYHIHARVGFTEGPQVMDPRAAEWHDIVEKHLAWWQQVINKNNLQGKTSTITTEFGPFPYLQHLPYTNTPIYDQWAVNVHMMHLLRTRFGG